MRLKFLYLGQASAYHMEYPVFRDDGVLGKRGVAETGSELAAN
jgi:hypothetical protein